MSRIQVSEKEIFKFEELSDSAKESARIWYRDASEYDSDSAGYIIDDAKQCAKLIGIDIDKVYYSGFSSQGDGASFTGFYSYVKGGAKALKAHAPLDTELNRIANDLQTLQRKAFYRLSASISQRGHYSHYNTMQVSVDDSTSEDQDEELTQLLRDFADWIYDLLEKEYDYQNSDSVIDESLVLNEYEFYIDGKPI